MALSRVPGDDELYVGGYVVISSMSRGFRSAPFYDPSSISLTRDVYPFD